MKRPKNIFKLLAFKRPGAGAGRTNGRQNRIKKEVLVSGERSGHCCPVSDEEGKDVPLHALRDASPSYIWKLKITNRTQPYTHQKPKHNATQVQWTTSTKETLTQI